jgi:hypothetical protein
MRSQFWAHGLNYAALDAILPTHILQNTLKKVIKRPR